MIDYEYREHQVFDVLTEYAEFYQSLSFSIYSFISNGTGSGYNTDSYVFSAIQGTIESIKDILIKGRINDSYALLRKYYDSAIINTYTNLYLSENFSLDNFVVEKIDQWIKGKKQLPDFRKMSQYIRESKKMSEINELLYVREKRYKGIRGRCNDHVHFNSYQNILYNDNQIFLKDRLDALNTFSHDLDNIFILHFSYLFILNDQYMMASDYVDCLDCGLTPEKDSQYFVAPFIQAIFDKVVKKIRIDIAELIKMNSAMKLD